MDKETLSNYGWIVICVLVLAVMIALATPFGKFVSNAVQNTTQGLFDVNQKALNQTGLLIEEIPDQEFDGINEDIGDETEKIPVVAGATFRALKSNTCHQGLWDHIDSCYEGVLFLTWEELRLAENGTKYSYDAQFITDTTIGTDTFFDYPNLKSIIIPEGITTIKTDAFFVCSNLESITLPSSINSLENCAFESSENLKSITFKGTMAQWNRIIFGEEWNFGIPATEVICSDGTVSLS